MARVNSAAIGFLSTITQQRCLPSCCEAGSGAVTISGPKTEARNIDLARRICEILDPLLPAGRPHSKQITMVKDRPGHDFRYAIDTARVQSELGWSPQFNMEEALEMTVRWYLDNQSWVRAFDDYMENQAPHPWSDQLHMRDLGISSEPGHKSVPSLSLRVAGAFPLS